MKLFCYRIDSHTPRNHHRSERCARKLSTFGFVIVSGRTTTTIFVSFLLSPVQVFGDLHQRMSNNESQLCESPTARKKLRDNGSWIAKSIEDVYAFLFSRQIERVIPVSSPAPALWFGRIPTFEFNSYRKCPFAKATSLLHIQESTNHH